MPCIMIFPILDVENIFFKSYLTLLKNFLVVLPNLMTAQFTSSGMIFHHVCSCHVVAHQTLFYLWSSTCTWEKHCLSCWLCFCSCCYFAAEFVDWDSFTSFSCHLLSFLSCLHIGRKMVLLTKSLSLTLPIKTCE